MRVLERLDRLYAIGDGPGANRLGGTREEDEAHSLVAGWMREAGLEVEVDGAGNLFGRLRGRRPELPEVWTGSHLDSVPHGGRFDGALGRGRRAGGCRELGAARADAGRRRLPRRGGLHGPGLPRVEVALLGQARSGAGRVRRAARRAGPAARRGRGAARSGHRDRGDRAREGRVRGPRGARRDDADAEPGGCARRRGGVRAAPARRGGRRRRRRRNCRTARGRAGRVERDSLARDAERGRAGAGRRTARAGRRGRAGRAFTRPGGGDVGRADARRCWSNSPRSGSRQSSCPQERATTPACWPRPGCRPRCSSSAA